MTTCTLCITIIVYKMLNLSRLLVIFRSPFGTTFPDFLFKFATKSGNLLHGREGGQRTDRLSGRGSQSRTAKEKATRYSWRNNYEALAGQLIDLGAYKQVRPKGEHWEVYHLDVLDVLDHLRTKHRKGLMRWGVCCVFSRWCQLHGKCKELRHRGTLDAVLLGSSEAAIIYITPSLMRLGDISWHFWLQMVLRCFTDLPCVDVKSYHSGRTKEMVHSRNPAVLRRVERFAPWRHKTQVCPKTRTSYWLNLAYSFMFCTRCASVFAQAHQIDRT